MFAILWLLFVAFIVSIPLVWLLDHNGTVLINWIGYEIRTDVTTSILLAIAFTAVIFFISYVFTRILAIKFPSLLKAFFKRKYVRSLEKIIRRQQKALTQITQLLVALEVKDEKSSNELQKKVSQLVKNSQLNQFFLAKLSYNKGDYSKAAELFEKLEKSNNTRVLAIQSKLNLALEKKDEVSAIAYAKQILTINPQNFLVAETLLSLYKSRGLWQEAKKLIKQYGPDKFKGELQKRDVAVLNTSLAMEAYQNKKIFKAVSYARNALKAEPTFLPATEILLKSWIKLGLGFKANWKIKNLWKERPHLILAEIFSLIYRKGSTKSRIRAIRKLAELNNDSALGKLAIGVVAFRTGCYKVAKEFLYLSLLQEKTYRAYKLLAFTEKALGNREEMGNALAKAQMLSKDDHYFCTSCNHISPKWAPKCPQCGSPDSLEWEK